MGVLVLVEHEGGAVDELSLQALSLARALAGGGPLTALLVGPGGADAAAELGAHGVASAHVAEHERLGAYAPGAWARSVTDLIERLAPSGVVAAGSSRGNEVLSHVAARLDLPFAANCTAVRPGDPLEVTRVRWGGSLLEEARVHARPALVSAAPHMVAAATVNGADAPALETFAPELDESDLLVRVGEHVEAETQRDLPGRGQGRGQWGARCGVRGRLRHPGGAGRRSRRGGGLLARGDERRLASAHRPGRPDGTKVSPDLYIACGISGATQHIAGCKGAKKILAINSDREAPILSNADYAVIGDLTEIVPAITAELRRARST